MSEQNLLALWKRGTPLAEAYANPSEETIGDEYGRIRPDARSVGQPSGDQPEIGAGLQTVLAATQSLAYYAAESRAVEQSQQALLEEILAEDLVGLGFEPPLNTAGSPQIIPLHVWPSRAYEIDWYDSSFSKNGIEFLNIRAVSRSTIESDPLLPSLETARKSSVGRPSITPEDLEDDSDQKPLPDVNIAPRRGPGRPSHGKKIDEVYQRLKEEGKINYAGSKQEAVELIRETLWALFPELAGDMTDLKDKTILKRITRRFDGDKLDQ